MSSGELLSYTNLKKLLLDQCQRDLKVGDEGDFDTERQRIVINRLDQEWLSNNYYKVKYRLHKN